MPMTLISTVHHMEILIGNFWRKFPSQTKQILQSQSVHHCYLFTFCLSTHIIGIYANFEMCIYYAQSFYCYRYVFSMFYDTENKNWYIKLNSHVKKSSLQKIFFSIYLSTYTRWPNKNFPTMLLVQYVGRWWSFVISNTLKKIGKCLCLRNYSVFYFVF